MRGERPLFLVLTLLLLTACTTASTTTGAATPTLQARRTPRRVDTFVEPATPVLSASPTPLAERSERPVHFNMLVGGEPGQYLYRAEFQTPTGMALGPDGNIYVADFLGRRVVSISPDGTITDLEFWKDPDLWLSDGPRDVGFDSQGRLYVSDSRSLYRATEGGELLRLYDVQGKGPFDEFAFGPNDEVFFVVRGEGEVRGLSGMMVERVAGGLSRPLGVVIGLDGMLYVSEMDRERIVRVDPDSGTMSEFFRGFLPNDPVFLTLDAEGDLWVRGSFSLYQLSPEGILKPFSIDGVTYSRNNNTRIDFLRTAGGIAFDQAGRLWIATYNSQLLRLDPIAQDVFELVQLHAGLEASDMAVTPDGTVYVYNENVRQLWGIREPGVVEVLLEGDGPGRAGLAADAGGNLYVGLPGGEIRKMSPEGEFSHFAFVNTRRMIVAGDGNLYAQVGEYGQPKTIMRVSGVDQVNVFMSEVDGEIFGGAGVGEISLAPAQGGLYIYDGDNGALYLVDFAGKGELLAVFGGFSPMAASPEGEVFVVPGYSLTRMDPDLTADVLARLQGDPWAMGLSPDGQWLYVAESGAIDMIPLQP